MTLWGGNRAKAEGMLEERLAVIEEEQAILGKVSAFFAKQRQTETGSTR